MISVFDWIPCHWSRLSLQFTAKIEINCCRRKFWEQQKCMESSESHGNVPSNKDEGKRIFCFFQIVTSKCYISETTNYTFWLACLTKVKPHYIEPIERSKSYACNFVTRTLSIKKNKTTTIMLSVMFVWTCEYFILNKIFRHLKWVSFHKAHYPVSYIIFVMKYPDFVWNWYLKPLPSLAFVLFHVLDLW